MARSGCRRGRKGQPHHEDRLAGPGLILDEAAVAAHQVLGNRQTETGAVRAAGDQRVEDGLREVCRHAGAVVLDLDAQRPACGG